MRKVKYYKFLNKQLIPLIINKHSKINNLNKNLLNIA